MSEDSKDIRNKSAVALSYDKSADPAPKVVAKGAGHIAENIVKIAQENNVPIHEDRALVDLLSTLDLEDFIPLEAYVAVAEILTYIYTQKES